MHLEDLFKEIRDLEVSDPIAMDKVLEYLDEIENEINDYIEVLADKFSEAIITWVQPWYQEATSYTQTKVENCEGKPNFLVDPLSQDETEKVLKNWKKLVKKYQIPDKLSCFARWRNKTRSKIISPQENARRFINSYLARGLQRTIPQIYQHVLNHYAHPPKGRYNQDEEKVMDICFYHSPKKAVQIAALVLDRGHRGILKRYHYSLNGKPEFNRIKWNLSLATKLLKLLMENTGETLEGLKNKYIDISIWREIEKHFETQACYLRYFWYTCLHCQLFIKYDVTLRRVRKRVFKTLRRFPYKFWTDIRWKEVVAEFPEGFTFQFLYRITIRIFRNNKVHTKLPLEEVINIGLQHSAQLCYGNKRLKTLILNKQGNLEPYHYSDKF